MPRLEYNRDRDGGSKEEASIHRGWPRDKLDTSMTATASISKKKERRAHKYR